MDYDENEDDLAPTVRNVVLYNPARRGRSAPNGKKIYVSRHGFTAWPAFGNHMKLSAIKEGTVCPFCDTHIMTTLEAEGKGPVKKAVRALMVGKSRILAANLLGTTTFASCSSDDMAPRRIRPRYAT